MEKIEYSDLNKFFVSTGLTLILISVLLPWIYLRESFDLTISQEQILKLTKEAQIIIRMRQGFVFNAINYILLASLFLFCCGLISTIIGLFRWIKKQKGLDEREIIITATHRFHYEKLTKEEISEKAEMEFVNFKQNNNSVKNKIQIEEFVPKYLQLERGFFEKFMKFYYKDYRILSNYRIDKFEYDIILESRNGGIDFIFEIKYYPISYKKRNVQDAIIKLENSTLSYIENTKRIAKPIIIIIVHDDDFNNKELMNLNQFSTNNLKALKKLSLGILNFNQLEQITKNQIDGFLFDEGKPILKV